jgi:hypothetical protein
MTTFVSPKRNLDLELAHNYPEGASVLCRHSCVSSDYTPVGRAASALADQVAANS